MTLHIVQIKMRSREQLLTREATKPKRLGAEENHLEDSHEAQMRFDISACEATEATKARKRTI